MSKHLRRTICWLFNYILTPLFNFGYEPAIQGLLSKLLPALLYYQLLYIFAYNSFSLFSLERISTELLPPSTLQSCWSRSPPSCLDQCSPVHPLNIYFKGKDTGTYSSLLKHFPLAWLSEKTHWWPSTSIISLPQSPLLVLPPTFEHLTLKYLKAQSSQIPSFSPFVP